jgi:hypothetical protein
VGVSDVLKVRVQVWLGQVGCAPRRQLVGGVAAPSVHQLLWSAVPLCLLDCPSSLLYCGHRWVKGGAQQRPGTASTCWAGSTAAAV